MGLAGGEREGFVNAPTVGSKSAKSQRTRWKALDDSLDVVLRSARLVGPRLGSIWFEFEGVVDDEKPLLKAPPNHTS